MITTRFLIACCLTLSVLASEPVEKPESGNWPRWRGPSDSGSVAGGNWPADLSGDNVLWKTPLPGKGCSTPIVLNQKIYVTAPVDGKDALLCLNLDGVIEWKTTFAEENKGKHRNGSGCNASPVTDGEAVYVYFKSGTLAAVEFDGSVRWQTNLVDRFGKVNLFWDHGTSPVLTTKHVVMARMHNGESWLAAFDRQSGEMAWKQARNFKTPVEGDHGYATPLVIRHNGAESILVWGAEHLTIHNAADGAQVWQCGQFNPDQNKLWPSIATPVIVGDHAVIAFGRNDRGIPRLHGVRLSGNGDVTDSAHVWLRDDVGTFVPSPVAAGKFVYLVRDRGQVECVDPATGKTVWKDALPKGRANYYASPLIAGELLYAPREDGTVFVASIANGQLRLLSENEMGEPVIGSPVPTGGRILIRGNRHLFCIGAR